MRQVQHFFICGAQRSASTYLSKLLDSHPAIEMAKPIRPEPKVFLSDVASELTPELYRHRWHQAASEKTVWFGEKSTSYIEDAKVPERILSVFKNPKFIFVLRDPIDRAISNYHFSKMNGYEDANIDTALLREVDSPETNKITKFENVSVSPKAYLERGIYVKFLKPYFQQIPKDNILLLESQNLTSSQDEKERLFHFLNLDASDNQFTNSPINVSQKDKDQNISPKTRDILQAYFRDSNLQLKNTYNFQISNWA